MRARFSSNAAAGLRGAGRLVVPLLAAVGFSAGLAAPAHAQHVMSLGLELNALTPSDTGCRVTFLATNGLGTTLTRAAFEVALFGASGGIERLVSLDFKTMPEGKTKVLQFDLAELGCDGISRVLVNDVAACEGEGLDPKACLAALKTTSRLSVTFGT